MLSYSDRIYKNMADYKINSNIIKLQSNFQDGCRRIADAITSNGVATSANASPNVIATNINTACINKYNAGKADGDIKHTITLQVAAYNGNYNAYCDLRIDGTLVFQWTGNANNQNGHFTKSI